MVTRGGGAGPASGPALSESRIPRLSDMLIRACVLLRPDAVGPAEAGHYIRMLEAELSV